MADRIDEFLFRGYIPEEARGGAYHVVINIGGKLIGPLTPKQADEMGWSLTSIVADINMQVMTNLTDANKALADTESELRSVKADFDALKKIATSEIGQAQLFMDDLAAKYQTALKRIAELEAEPAEPVS